MAKIEEISRKKDELNVEFMTQTKEALITKMEHSEEKREAIISDLKEKLKVIFGLIETRVYGDEKEVAECNFNFEFPYCRFTPTRSSGTRKCWRNRKSTSEML